MNVCVCFDAYCDDRRFFIDSAISFDIEQINTDRKFILFLFSVLEFQFIIFICLQNLTHHASNEKRDIAPYVEMRLTMCCC